MPGDEALPPLGWAEDNAGTLKALPERWSQDTPPILLASASVSMVRQPGHLQRHNLCYFVGLTAWCWPQRTERILPGMSPQHPPSYSRVS